MKQNIRKLKEHYKQNDKKKKKENITGTAKTSWSIRPNPEDQINRKPDN